MAASFKRTLKEIIFWLFESTPVSGGKTVKDPIRSILIFEGGGIGDLLRLFPAVRALRAHFPEASVSFLISPHALDVLRLYGPDLKSLDIIHYGSKGEHASIFRKIRMICNIRARNFDLIYSPSRGEGMRELALMVFLMGGRYTFGFRRGKIGGRNTKSIEFEENRPILLQNLALLESAGIDVKDRDIKVYIPPEAFSAAKRFTGRTLDPSLPAVSIHPCADWKARHRCWPLKNYIKLINILQERYGVSVVLIGSEREAAIGEEIISMVRGNGIINTMGKTSIAEMASIISITDLFIGNDSGPIHLALALNIPSIGLFGPTSPEQVLSAADKCIAIKGKATCSPCYMHQHFFHPFCSVPECMENITVEEVAAAAEKVFSQFSVKNAT